MMDTKDDDRMIDMVEDKIATIVSYVWLVILYSIIILGTYKIAKSIYEYLIG